MSEREYDVIVIGAGVAGENVADRAVQGGLTAVIVESERVGGECSYWACMPSKALLRPAAALRAARDVRGAADAVTGDLDVAEVFHRRDDIIHHGDDASQVRWLESAHIDLVRGSAELTGIRRVRVAGADGAIVDLRARHAVAVCTGSEAVIPDALSDVRPWTSREATSAHRAPASLAVVGGGVVACELATAYAGFGTAVTLLARSGLLRGMEPFAGETVAAALEDLGVDVRLGASVARAERGPDGVTLTLGDGSELAVEEVLAATGRRPRIDGLGLDTVGVERLDVDDTMLVRGTDWLYAVGDVNGRVLLTHQGKYQARAAGDVIAARALGRPVDDAPWGAHVATADHDAVPQATFTDPEVASVGFTEASAIAAGRRIRVLDYDLSWIAGATTRADHYEGRARAIVDEDRHTLIGATFVGPDVAELLHAATIAVVGEVPLDRLWHAVPAYPTLSEVWLRWLEAYGRPTP